MAVPQVKITGEEEQVPQLPPEPQIPQVRVLKPEPVITVKQIVADVEKIVLPMKIRKTLDGKIYISDHATIDIVIDPQKTSIISFAKDDKMKDTYYVQKNLYDFLKNNGLISLDSIQGGFLYGSLEAKFVQNDKVDSISAILLGIYRFLQQEEKDRKILTDYEKAEEEELTDPDDSETTDFEKANSLHAAKKGSIDPKQKQFGLLYRI